MAKEFRIFGPPGVGKTTYASEQVKRAAEKLGPDEVMVASFTKTAAAEIGSRGLGLGERQVGTLHSFANRAIGGGNVVNDFKGLRAWNALHWRDDRKLSLERSNDELDFSGDGGGKTEGDRLYALYMLYRNRMTPRVQWEPDVLGFAHDWEDYKQQAKGIDFTDMIEIALRERLMPGRYSAAFIDEAQDLSRLELAYTRFVGEQMDYFVLLGDPNQAIYNFKGATPKAFLESQLPKENVRVLGQSYRVPKAVHAFAMPWQLLPLEYKPRDAPGVVRFAPELNTQDFDLFFLPELKTHLEAGKNVMFLTSAGYMALPIAKALMAAALPFANPYRPTQREWNPLRQGDPRDPASRFMNFFRNEAELWGDQKRSPSYEQLWPAVQYLSASAFRPGAKMYLESFAKDRYRKTDTADMREYIAPRLLEGTLPSRMNLYTSLMWDKLRPEMAYFVRLVEKYGGEVMRREPQITLGTIHSVKGAQADIVYVFPELSPSALRAWYVLGDERDAVIRTYYVGLTRAREQVVLCGLHRDGVNWQEQHAPLVAS